MNTPEHMQIANIDWLNWQPQASATLLFVQQNNQVLLIRKKRGLGAGKINGPGGHIEIGETPMQCAIRETKEELDITPLDVKANGELFFHAEDMPRLHVFLFTATGFTGTPTESAEAIPRWTRVDQIPFEAMWQDDKHWLPSVLAGKTIKGWFSFAGETLLDYRLNLV